MGDLIRASIEDHLWVIPQIQQIANDISDPELTREIIEACRLEQAFLFLTGKGFVVLKPIVENGTRRILIWIAYSKDDLSAHYISEIEKLGILIDAQELEFWTKRKGFLRLAPKLGFELHEVKDSFFIWRKRHG